MQKATNQYRSQLKQKFEEMGFGPGALVSFREGTYARERKLITGMIKEIGLNDVSPISKGRIGRVAIMCMTGPKSGKTIYHSFFVIYFFLFLFDFCAERLQFPILFFLENFHCLNIMIIILLLFFKRFYALFNYI